MGICFDTALLQRGEGCAKILYQRGKKSPVSMTEFLLVYFMTFFWVVFSSPILLLFQVFPSQLFMLLITKATAAAHLIFGRTVKDCGFINTSKPKDYYVFSF